MPLSPAQRELLLLHILITTSGSPYRPVRFADGPSLLAKIVADYNLAKPATKPGLTWAYLGSMAANDVARAATAAAIPTVPSAKDSYSNVSSIFQKEAVLAGWPADIHPDIGEVMEFLGLPL